MPCFELGIRFDRPDMVKRFLPSKLTGVYMAILRQGDVAAGDTIEYTDQQESGVTIADMVRLYTSNFETQELLRRATELPAPPNGWKDLFRKHRWDPDS